MLVTDREAWADEARYLTTQARDDPDEYIHGEIGYNYRLPNLLAAVGCAQIEVLDAHIEAKRAIADRYAEALSSMAGITCMREAPYAFCTFWLYTVRVQAEAYGEDSRGLRKRLWASGIESRPLWQPLHRSPAHEGAQHFRCGEAEALYRECLSLPCSVGLSREDQDRVIELLAKGR